MKKRIARMLCAVMVLSLFAGCASDEAHVPTGDGLADLTEATDATEMTAPGILDQNENMYTLAYYSAEGFNPYLCTSFNNRMIFGLLYQGLFSVDRNYVVEPVLCKSFTVSEDLRTYTITLEQAVFSDGAALTAADVVASLTAAKESSLYTGRFDLIESFEALDDRTVQVVCYYSYENLPMLLDIPIVRQSQVASNLPDGTGPYTIETKASGMTLQRRQDWWCQAELPITAVSIPLRAFENPQEIRDSFEFENLGISIADPGSGSYAEYRCDFELWEAETGIFLYLACNLSSDVFSHSEVREALTYAIDRSAILEDCYNGFGAAATLPASPNSPFYDHGLANSVTFDSVRFEQAVADAGLIGEEISLLVNKSDSVRLRTARLVAQMLTDCGLVVTIEDWSTPYFVDRIKIGDFDLYLGQTKLSPSMDLSQFFSGYGELSYGGLSDSAIYAMDREALENSGNFYNLHQMVLEDGRVVPILFRTYAVYAKRGLAENLQPARDNVFYYSLGRSLEDARTIDYDE